MGRKFNFGAGPATLPTSVLEEVKNELLDWKGKGLSVMEISHRSDDYTEIAHEAEKDFRKLLNISESYSVLFSHGGATIHNAMIPLNFSSRDGEACYVMSGHWASASMKEAKKAFELVPTDDNRKVMELIQKKISGVPNKKSSTKSASR